MPALILRNSIPRHGRHPCLRAVGAVLLGLALGCNPDRLPTEPDLKPGGGGAAFTVDPTSLAFAVPRATPATLTVSSQSGGSFTASSSDVNCAAVNPPSATATKPKGSMLYMATFTVTAGPILAPCTIVITDKKGRTVSVPVQVSASQVVLRQESVTTGFVHSCALDADGKAYCWGEGDLGRLGNGTTNDHFTPAPVSGNLTFTSLTAGALHTCGLDFGQKAWCWGSNGFGQLGDGTVQTERHTPVAVQGPGGSPALTLVQITAGTGHTCAIDVSGKAYCWGRDFEGQVGDGDLSDRYTPSPVASGVRFANLEADGHHTCGLTSDGKAYCWGWNQSGQLGDGTGVEGQSSPSPVSGAFTFIGLAAGGGFSEHGHTCAHSSSQTYCWGDNGFGQLGIGAAGNQSTPALLSGATFSGLAGGASHTCGLDGSGLAFCWGKNISGELGDGTNTNKNVPSAVVGPGGGAALSFTGLAGGNAHTCGRETSGNVYCWGDNASGQVGDGSPGGAHNTPRLVTLGLSTPSITSVVLDSYEIPIEGGTLYTAILENPGPSMTGLILQGEMFQGSTVRAAGGHTVGTLASGTSTRNGGVSASNQNTGNGTLVPGPATYVLALIDGSGTTLDSESIPVTLQ